MKKNEQLYNNIYDLIDNFLEDFSDELDELIKLTLSKKTEDISQDIDNISKLISAHDYLDEIFNKVFIEI